MSKIMPGVIAVSDFVRETREDINSPTTSGFVNRIPQCKETVHKLEEVRPNFIYIF
jgi:Arf-GAP/SH3 domain/ANK repeat/PH domain-containing protein